MVITKIKVQKRTWLFTEEGVDLYMKGYARIQLKNIHFRFLGQIR